MKAAVDARAPSKRRFSPHRSFLPVCTFTDCCAVTVAPPSCPPFTALMTHAVYSARAEGKTEEELRLAF